MFYMLCVHVSSVHGGNCPRLTLRIGILELAEPSRNYKPQGRRAEGLSSKPSTSLSPSLKHCVVHVPVQ